jgi:hypothetical protein
MKQFLLMAGFVLLATFCHAQTIDEVPVGNITSTYVKILAQRTNSAGRYTVFISFGQEEFMRDRKGTPIKDAAGNDIIVNTPVKALNMMDELGYELVKAYMQETENVEHYLLKRRE